MEQRKELACEVHPLPSRYWEPQPDEEDLERIERELERKYRESGEGNYPDEPLPFE